MKVLKWTMFIVLGIIIILFVTAYMLLRDNPAYVLKHLDKNPKNSALYVTVDNNEKIAYHSDTPHPLASVAKITIALEYAYQVANGDINNNDSVQLSALEKFHIKNTDGGAHEAWLEEMEEKGNIHDETVSLHDVASGMITYSSNANADFLMDLLGAEKIDQRMEKLGLEHDPIVPFTGSLAAVGVYKQQNKDWDAELRAMSDATFRELAIDTLQEMTQDDVDFTYASEATLSAQRVWSDRLANAPAETYGKLLKAITNDEFPEDVTATIQDLMEWPMEINEENKDYYKVLGSKGGSTAFVFNDTMYVEDLEGKQLQIVLFMDDLSFWESFMLQRQENNFMVEMINNEDFLNRVEKTLQ